MTTYRIASVAAGDYPTVSVTFTDGFCGPLDLTDSIARGGLLAPLRDEDYFRSVSVGAHGLTFGWNLDSIGHEIDFCPDTTRIRIETQVVEMLADRFAATRAAAE